MRIVCMPIVVVLTLFLNISLIYANASLPKAKTKEIPVQVENRIEGEKKPYENFKEVRIFSYEKIVKRTVGCKDELDNMFLILNNLAKKAHEEKKIKDEKELILVMSDYNSLLGDIGIMQTILGLRKFAEGEKFMEYYEVMLNGLESLRRGFSFEHGVILNRIDKELKSPDALRYEKKLSRICRDYFEYDPKIDRIEESEDFIKSRDKKVKEKGR
ncbi:MAG: hypothetical protein WCY09_02475 [Candidatus Omnitrophota bacterium]